MDTVPVDWTMVRQLLAKDGIELSDDAISRMTKHVALLLQLNPVVSVVSLGDLDAIWERHIFDSLSLAPVLARLGVASGSLLDIGSGGGFPALVLKTVLPDLRVTLVERSEKKIGFLRKVVGALGLKDVAFVCGVFPQAVREVDADVVTARAVERSEGVVREILVRLGSNGVFLLQNLADLGGGYQEERVADMWTEAGLRRGVLRVVRRSV